MNTHNQIRAAAKIAVLPECSGAKVVLGWRSVQVQVLELSRDAFTLRVSHRVAKQMRGGKHFRLDYRGESSLIACQTVLEENEAGVTLEVIRLQDVTRQSVESASILSGGLLGNRKVTPTDPTLPVGVVLGIVLILLITPGWGDDLGTSQYLSDVFSMVAQSIKEIVAGG